MSDQPVRFTPLGNLDKDSEYKLVGKGNYTDALDIIKQDDAGQVSGTIQPTQRNKHAFSLGSVQAQNKKYRVTVDGDATKSHAIKFLSTKKDIRITTGTGSDGSVEFNGDINNLYAAFNLSNLPGAFQVTVSGNTMEFELVAYNYYDWYLESTGTDDVSVVCIQEAIPTDLAGPLKDIGSYDLLGDLFVFSTTQDNEPTELEAEIIGVGPIAPNPIPPPAFVLGGPLTSLTFNAEHGLQEGQWIRITDSNASWLNGTFVVNSVTSPTGIEIVTDTAWGASHPTFIIGQEKTFIHPTGIGEIGVAQKNNSTSTWTYTRLLRSWELNYVSKYMINSVAEKNSDRSAIYFDDDYNANRVFYYYGQYLEDGALEFNYSENYYSFSQLSLQLYGAPIKPNVKIDFFNQLQSGGNCPSGNIRYFCLLKDNFGNWTKPSDLSNFVITYSDESSGLSLGDSTDTTNTNKVNVLNVFGINTDVYSEVRLGYYTVVDGVPSAFLLDEVDVISSSMNLPHNGFCSEESFDVGELASNFITGYEFGKSINIVDQRLVRTNLRKKDLLDFRNWSKTFKHRIKEKFLICSSFASDANEYQDPENGFKYVGYMFNETYRFAVRGIFKETGEYSPWFWVDDIKIDPFLTNEGNPNDNRRDQTGSDIVTNYDLTKNIGGPYPTNRWVKIPHVEFFDVDLNFPINGVSVSDLFESIEFGRAELIPEVLCTGVATSSVRINGLSGENAAYRKSPDSTDEQVFTEEDENRFACFPFSHIETNNNLWMKYLIQFPSSVDLEATRFEYPFVYGPPSHSGSYGVTTANYATAESQDQIPAFEYPQADNVTFGGTVTIQTDPANIPFFPWTSDRSFYSLYSPDIMMNKVSDISGYSFVDFGEMFLGVDDYTFNRSAANQGSMYSQYSVYFPENLQDTFSEYDIGEWKHLDSGQNDFIADGKFFQKSFGVAKRNVKRDLMRAVDNSHKNFKGPVIYVDNSGNGVIQQGKNPDYGVRYFQLYKKLENKYCAKENQNYYTTNSIYEISSIPSSSGVAGKGFLDVFGGDTFTQLTYLKGRFIDFAALEESPYNSWGEVGFGGSPGFGGGMKFYSQNRVNSQMRYDDPEQIVYLSDGTSPIYPWLEEHLGKNDLMSYSSKYNPTLPTELYQPSYGVLSDEKKDYPQRIEFSEKKIYSSESDSYLNRLPLNIKDLDLSFGEIIHHQDINGELFTIQPRKYQLQYFNTRGTLQGSNEGVEVLIGDGSVLSRDGQTLSSYGTQHKWSVVKGSSPGGKDVIYWFNQENGLFMRFGADGTVVLSERHGIRSFSANNTRWTEDQHTPAFNYGIRSVWDDRFKEAIWTFIGVREYLKWEGVSRQTSTSSTQTITEYTVGQGVTGSTYVNYEFEQIPDIYVCILSHTNTQPESEPGVGSNWETYWRRVDKDDPEYYTAFTLAFNELSNGFSTFYTHLPKTYLKWKNKFLSSHPTERSEIYEHRYGYDKWYEYDGVWKESEPYLEGVVNPFPDQSKKFVAIQALTDNVPDRIELKTKDHESFLVATDFDPEDDAWRTPIKNDILTSPTSDPNDDTVSLIGSYMRVKFKFFNGAYNKMNNLVVKVRQRLRRTQS